MLALTDAAFASAPLAAARALVQYVLHGVVDAPPLVNDASAISSLLSLALMAHRLDLPALYVGALTRLGEILLDDFAECLASGSLPSSGAVLLLGMLSAGELSDAVIDGPVYTLCAACYAHHARAVADASARPHQEPLSYWDDPWAQLVAYHLRPTSGQLDPRASAGATAGGDAPDCTRCRRFYACRIEGDPHFGLCSNCASAETNQARVEEQRQARLAAAATMERVAVHRCGSAEFARKVVARPELAGLGAAAKEQLQYELGSDNLRKLLKCKRAFVSSQEWLAANRVALAEPGAADEALVDEACERRAELEEKRPRYGPSLRLGEKTPAEMLMIDEIDRLREALLEEYKVALGEEDEVEDDEQDVDDEE